MSICLQERSVRDAQNQGIPDGNAMVCPILGIRLLKIGKQNTVEVIAAINAGPKFEAGTGKLGVPWTDTSISYDIRGYCVSICRVRFRPNSIFQVPSGRQRPCAMFRCNVLKAMMTATGEAIQPSKAGSEAAASQPE